MFNAHPPVAANVDVPPPIAAPANTEEAAVAQPIAPAAVRLNDSTDGDLMRFHIAQSLKPSSTVEEEEERMLQEAIKASLAESGIGEASTSNAVRQALNDTDTFDRLKTCSICFERYTSKTPEHRLCCMPCGHLFGKACIIDWLTDPAHRTCPTCSAPCTVNDVIVVRE